MTAPKSQRLSALVLKAAVLAALLAAGFLLLRYSPLKDWLDRERLAAALAMLREAWWSPFALLALYVALAPLGLPMTPLIFASAAVFGTVVGGAYNVLGCFLGAAASFLLARWLGRDLVVRLAGERLRSVERLLARHGFWSLLRIRFVPVPFALVNFGAALAGVPLSTFLLSSALGLLPAIAVFTHFFASLTHAAAEDRGGLVVNLVGSLAALLALSLLPAAWTRCRRSRRYRGLLAKRRARR
jgi:uncharacterized membrane protein YdjX (TVP38/TMEM64 family)